MVGAVIVAFVVVIAIPVGLLMFSSAAAAVVGWTLKTNAEELHEGSELVEFNE